MPFYRDKGEAYGPRRGEAGVLGGLSARDRPSDFATPVLERRACLACEYPTDF